MTLRVWGQGRGEAMNKQGFIYTFGCKLDVLSRLKPLVVTNGENVFECDMVQISNI